MGIKVLPPDVNTSQWDFSIEDNPGQPSAIRFGLGAVKNVGSEPVLQILGARADGKFKNLNDFIQRVNLQKVGKRTLEFMIKVGALDAFGSRNALLPGDGFHGLHQRQPFSRSGMRAVEHFWR